MSYCKAKMLQNRFLPAYAGRAYSASPDLLARFKGPYLQGRGGKKRDLAAQKKKFCRFYCYLLLIIVDFVNEF